MKKRVLYAIAVMASLALSGTSCTTDKNSDNNESVSSSVNLPVLTLLRLQEENL